LRVLGELCGERLFALGREQGKLDGAAMASGLNFLTKAIDTLSETPARAVELTQGLSQEQLSRRVNPEFFSLRESVLHLRDIEVEGYEPRIRRILSEVCPVLADVNGAAAGDRAQIQRAAARPGARGLVALPGSKQGQTESVYRIRP
jgi:hypothetical protein